jgi:hypothetical protein
MLALFQAPSRADLVQALSSLATALATDTYVATIGPGHVRLDMPEGTPLRSPFPLLGIADCCGERREWKSEAEMPSLSEACDCGATWFVHYGAG